MAHFLLPYTARVYKYVQELLKLIQLTTMQCPLYNNTSVRHQIWKAQIIGMSLAPN